ncbi:hypothetical protein M758_UG301300 [Ceratodon purpureus]|nr:hypothetical protein M758_UG301300 [Ceratodon purpureus]
MHFLQGMQSKCFFKVGKPFLALVILLRLTPNPRSHNTRGTTPSSRPRECHHPQQAPKRSSASPCNLTLENGENYDRC